MNYLSGQPVEEEKTGEKYEEARVIKTLEGSFVANIRNGKSCWRKNKDIIFYHVS